MKVHMSSTKIQKSLDTSIIPILHDSQICNTQSCTSQHFTEKISNQIPHVKSLVVDNIDT